LFPPHRNAEFSFTDSQRENEMLRGFGAAALLAIAISAPLQEAAAQDAVGGAILGGAAGAILGGAMGGGRGAAAGAIIGGSTGAIIGAQGQARPGGYYYYQNGCYMPRGNGTYVAVDPAYCDGGPPPGPAVAAPPPRAVAPPPPRAVAAPPPPGARAAARDELRERMLELREACDDGDRRSCIRLGIIIGENRERRAQWRREHPDVFAYER
jgi:hypothetical protein